MKQNRGYSLIEVVVVIAIMMVLAGVIGLQINMIWGFYSKECAKNLESQLNKVQITNMSRKLTAMKISQRDDGYYVSVIENLDNPAEKVLEEKKIGRKSLEVTYSTDVKDTTEYTLAGGTEIVIQFDRSTGALKVSNSGDPNRVNGCHRIWIRQKGSSKYYTVTIYKETGKIDVEADKVKAAVNSPT